MESESAQRWNNFTKHYHVFPELGFAIDLSRMDMPDAFFTEMEPLCRCAFAAMQDLEAGAISNPDENRMVGHYWLRDSKLAPSQEIQGDIDTVLEEIHAFTESVHSGLIRGERGLFRNLLVIGIGGSALGPQFVAHALGHPGIDKLTPYFFDNTDPDGIDRVLESLKGELGRTMCVVISKSGGTKETRNGMLEAQFAYRKDGLDFSKHAIAITGFGSLLHRVATSEGWIKSFPMWDWVGGRTSETSVVGLLPAALQGFNIRSLISGAAACDQLSRATLIRDNPSMLLALSWYYGSSGKGKKALVILPYKDRLELLSRYLQQLIMESLGKELDLEGKVVHQGLTVYGNKGSTDQHAFIQQLRDGLSDFFVHFIEVLHDRTCSSIEVEGGTTSGDYLFGFFMGTRTALYEKGRLSVTITIERVTAFEIGLLIALFERAVGFYASLIGVNAYHQPGVEAGKRAAANILEIQGKVVSCLKSQLGHWLTIPEVGELLGENALLEEIYKICLHLASNPDRGVEGHHRFDIAKAKFRAMS